MLDKITVKKTLHFFPLNQTLTLVEYSTLTPFFKSPFIVQFQPRFFWDLYSFSHS